jgi:DNA-binding MarR family transcriptional regulator
MDQGNLLIILKELEEMGLIVMKTTIKDGFRCHILKKTGKN